MNELKNRGVEDVLIAVVDGLKGFPDAITAVFPQAQVQTCIVHLIRNSLDVRVLQGPQGGRGGAQGDLPGRGRRCRRCGPGSVRRRAIGAADIPAIVLSWRRHWPAVIPFFAFPADVRRIVYTTNAIEALNAKLRRAVRTRGHFPSDEAALKLLYLVLNLAEREWRMPPREWGMARAQLAILFDDRFQLA